MNINRLKVSSFKDPEVRLWALSVIALSNIEDLSDPVSNIALESLIETPTLLDPSKRLEFISRFRALYSNLESAGVLGDLAIGRQSFMKSSARFSSSASGFLRIVRDGSSRSEGVESRPPSDAMRELAFNIVKALMDKLNLGIKPVLSELRDDYLDIRINFGTAKSSNTNSADEILDEAITPNIDPIYENLVKFLTANFKVGDLAGALSMVGPLQIPAEYKDAVMLEAVYRHRLIGDSSSLLSEMHSLIIHEMFDNLLPGKNIDGGLGEAKDLGEQLGSLIATSRDAGKPIHLEFGGGDAPGGMMTAYENPGSTVISIDPMARFVSPLLIFSPESLPNFTMLRGRAEAAALWAADEPYADSVLMVAPQPFNVDGLLLSAMLVTKPGGVIDIYSADPIKLDLLEKLGVDYSAQTIEWVEGVNHPTYNIDNGKNVRHIKIVMPELTKVSIPSPEGEVKVLSKTGSDSISFASFLEVKVAEEDEDGMLGWEGEPSEVLSKEPSLDLVRSTISIINGAIITSSKSTK